MVSLWGLAMDTSQKMRFIDLKRVFLDLENPRHEPYLNEGQVIEYLCRSENVYPLAKDIVKVGLNPLEMFAVIPDDGEHDDTTYTVAEGNRRLCALKLLDDPERAPPKLRKAFQELGDVWSGLESINCIVFPDRDSVKMWLSRIHEGEQGGIGRRKWDADQTARHSGISKNKTALALLDYAEAEKLITTQQRKGKLTTVQRYLVSPLVREALGIDSTNINDISRNRSKPDFDLLLRKFLDDLASGYVNSRTNKDQHIAYARELGALQGQTHERSEPVSLAASPAKGGKTAKPPRPKKPKSKSVLPYEPKIMKELQQLGGSKLISLYNSICSVPLNDHTPLVSIGVWAFIDSLSAKAGRADSTSFEAFFSSQRRQKYGIPTGKAGRGIEEAVKRIATAGNITKHEATAAFFNGDQLANDLETLSVLILKCAEEAKANNN